jgi:hypothetical protein
LLRSTVTGTFDKPAVRRMVDERAERMVMTGAKVGAEVASSVASSRNKTGEMAAIVVEGPEPFVDGQARGVRAAFASLVKHAWHNEYGTLGNRRKRLRTAPATKRTREPGTGVRPLGFLRAGRIAGTKAMLGEGGVDRR